MQFQRTKAAAMLAAAGLLSACGGDQTTTTTTTATTEPPASTAQYTGNITDPQGVALAQMSVLLENRLTDQRFETRTTADGNFTAAVEKGVYDVIFDDKDAAQRVSLKLLAVDLRADASQQVQLASAKDLPENLLTGTVTTIAGTPAAQRQLLILPAIARAAAAAGTAQVPDPFLVQTDAQGNFSQSLGLQGMDFDFDVLVLRAGAPALDVGPLAAGHAFASEEARSAFQQQFEDYLGAHVEESVDIEKPNGAMHMKLVLGAPVRNLRGAADTASVVPADASLLADQLQAAAGTPLQTAWLALRRNAETALLGMLSSAHAGDLISRFGFSALAHDAQGNASQGNFSGGKIDVSGCKHLALLDIADWPQGPTTALDTSFRKTSSVCATRTRGFSMLVYNYELRLKTLRAGRYQFTDESNDTYALRVYNPRPKLYGAEHIVRYNSKKPSIVGIGYQWD